MSDLDLSLSIPHNICLHLAPLPGFGVMYFCQEKLEKEKYHVSFDCLISDRSGKWADRFLLGTSPILACSRGNSLVLVRSVARVIPNQTWLRIAHL